MGDVTRAERDGARKVSTLVYRRRRSRRGTKGFMDYIITCLLLGFSTPMTNFNLRDDTFPASCHVFPR